MQITNWGVVAHDKKGLRSLMRSAGNDIKNKTQRLINSSQGEGRMYAGGGGAAYRGEYVAKPYRASAPGQPPVRVSGTLRQSMKTFLYPSGEGFAVRQRAFYALWLETGAQGGGNPYGGNPSGAAKWRAQNRRKHARSVFTQRVLEPRPSLDVVLAREEKDLTRRVETALRAGITWRETKGR
jgi:hypothetical protein